MGILDSAEQFTMNFDMTAVNFVILFSSQMSRLNEL